MALRAFLHIVSGLFLLALSAGPLRAQAPQDSLSLPVYRLELDPADLDWLHAHVWTDETVPATFYVQDQVYPCRVRFRGGTSRTLPKKSWRIVFEDDENVFGRKVLLLRAEYRDASLVRNHLVLSLFRFLGHPAPATQHVNLLVNGEHLGVFLDAERMDHRFLDRLDRPAGALYKARGHASNFAPLMAYDAVPRTWEKKEGPVDDFQDIQTLLGQLRYWTPADFAQHIEEVVDVDLALTYFAVELAVANEDGFTNNFYLYHNPEDGQVELIPWDNDATLGNNWRGEYDQRMERFYDHAAPDHNLLLQRLMEHAPWRTLFWDKVNFILDEGFAHITLALDEAYAAIREDVAQDAHKGTTTAKFEAERDRILAYLDARRTRLTPKGPYLRPDLSRLRVSNPFPTAANPEVVFQVEVEEPLAGLRIVYTTDLDFTTRGAPYTTRKLILYDDGRHADGQARDGVYGNRLLIGKKTGLVPFYVAYDNFKFPANGFSYSNQVPTVTYALRANAPDTSAFAALQWAAFYAVGEEGHLELHNPTARPVDVSHFYVQGRHYTERFMLPPGTVIGAGASVMVSTRRLQAQAAFPARPVVGNLYFDVAPGDTLRLLSPALTEVMHGPVPAANALPRQPDALILNEINYHAAEGSDAGDWLELYNPQAAAVEVTGWVVVDRETEQQYTFPAGYRVPGHGYAVVSRDPAAFEAVYPQVAVLGPLGFGLSNGGDHVQLFDATGALVDEVAYADTTPWPEAADGDGYTLELTHTARDNSRPENWQASLHLGGTPGAENSVFVGQSTAAPPGAAGVALAPVYPNPFSVQAGVPYHLRVPGHVRVAVFDVLGREVQVLVDAHRPAGRHEALWQPRAQSRGVYFIVLSVDGHPTQTQSVVRY